MRKISTAERSRRAGGAAARVRVQGRPGPLGPAFVRRTVRAVLAGEDRGAPVAGRRLAEISVTFLSRPAMQRLNRDWLGHDRPTDVLAFALAGPDQKVVGDMYICPAVARAQARQVGVPVREELIRLVVHGVLHVLGYDHPAGPTRTASPMWRRQERYVTVLA